MVHGSRFEVQSSGNEVQVLGFGVWGEGIEIEDLGFKSLTL